MCVYVPKRSDKTSGGTDGEKRKIASSGCRRCRYKEQIANLFRDATRWGALMIGRDRIAERISEFFNQWPISDARYTIANGQLTKSRRNGSS